MSKNPRRRGRPAIHDPELIAKLLAEREATGETYSSLSARSRIPAATLSGHAVRRRLTKRARRPAFVELVASTPVAPFVLEAVPDTAASLRVIVRTAEDAREVVVPRGFDPAELRRVIAILESPC